MSPVAKCLRGNVFQHDAIFAFADFNAPRERESESPVVCCVANPTSSFGLGTRLTRLSLASRCSLTEEKMGVPEEQQRLTPQGKQLTTGRTLKQHNIPKSDTIDPVTPAQRRNMDDDNRPNRTSNNVYGGKKPKRRASEACVDRPESQAVKVVEQIKNDKERLAKKLQEDMEKLTKQSHDSIMQTLRATLSTMNNDNKHTLYES